MDTRIINHHHPHPPQHTHTPHPTPQPKVGICLVGVSSILSGEGSSTHAVSQREMLLGMGLIVASQAVQAAQLTFEDFFMADLDMAPLKIVGFEGVFGSAMMLGLLLPAAYFLPGPEGLGLHEDTLDSLAMIRSSPALAVRG